MAASMFAAAAEASPDNADVQVRAAEGMARNGKLEEARDLIARRLKTAPAETAMRRTLASIDILQGRAEEAVQLLTAVLQRKPDDARALVNRGVGLDMLGRHADAQDDYRRALSLLPGDVAVSNDLALSLMLSGNLDEARQVLAPFRAQQGLPDRVSINLAILDAAIGRPELAQALLAGRLSESDLSALARAARTGGPIPKSNP